MLFSLLMFLICNSVKKRLQRRCLSVNFTKFLRIFFIRFNVFFYFLFFFFYFYFFANQETNRNQSFLFFNMFYHDEYHDLCIWKIYFPKPTTQLLLHGNTQNTTWKWVVFFLSLINWSTLAFIHYELTFIYYEFLHSIAL